MLTNRTNFYTKTPALSFGSFEKEHEIIARELGESAANSCSNEQDYYKALQSISAQKMCAVIRRGLPKSYEKTIFPRLITDSVERKIRKNDVESSNVEMLLDLVEEGALPSYVLEEFSNLTKISKNAEADLDKFYLAKAQRENIADVFVPEFEDEKSAFSNIKTGEVCKLEDDDFISIKKDEKTLLKLQISKEAYLELFPPIEKFIFNQSCDYGDCYFLAVLDSINQNPKSRYKILEMFKENPDGTLDACFEGFGKENSDGKFVLKDILNKIEQEKTKENKDEEPLISHTCKGLMALEILNEARYQPRAQALMSNQYEKFKNLRQAIIDKDQIKDIIFKREYREGKLNDADLSHLKEILGDDSVFYNNFIYSKDELDFYIDYFENHSSDDIFSVPSKDMPKLNDNQVKEKLKELEDKNDPISNYAKLLLTRYYERAFVIDNVAYITDECMPKEIYEYLADKPLIYSDGGYTDRTFRTLGFDNDILEQEPCDKKTKERLFSTDCKKYLFTCGANEKRDNTIVTKHAYSLEPRDVGGTRKFVIRNPYNSVNERVLSYEELCKYFDRITSVEI